MDDRSRDGYSRPGEPTNAAPGSPRKIRILMERAARREALFHPHDGMRRNFLRHLQLDTPPQANDN